MKSCFFIGHREVSTEILTTLTEAVERHIAQFGVTEFIVGNYGSFDHMAAKVVIAAKAQHPEIKLSMLLPCHPSEYPIDCPSGFDNTFYPPGMEKVPRKLAIVQANRYMVDHVDYLIAYAWHPASNTRNLLEYAQKRAQRHLISITTLPRC